MSDQVEPVYLEFYDVKGVRVVSVASLMAYLEMCEATFGPEGREPLSAVRAVRLQIAMSSASARPMNDAMATLGDLIRRGSR